MRRQLSSQTAAVNFNDYYGYNKDIIRDQTTAGTKWRAGQFFVALWDKITISGNYYSSFPLLLKIKHDFVDVHKESHFIYQVKPC